MKKPDSIIVFNNIKLPFDASVEEAFSVAKEKMRKMSVPTKDTVPFVYKRSIDARNKENIMFVYSIGVKGTSKLPDEKRLASFGASVIKMDKPEVKIGDEPLNSAPVVVGSGPAGMFAALLLAENGYAPTLIERGGNIAERKAAVESLNKLHMYQSLFLL